MCGRYSLSSTPEQIAAYLNARLTSLLDFVPNYNTAPTQVMPIVRLDNGDRELITARWGLIPYWADDPKTGNRMINARSETAATKPGFKQAFVKRRCIVPANGFYEWEPTGKPKQPWYFHRADEGMMLFAGLWERWSRNGESIDSYTILTTDAGEFVKPIHDRSPVILETEEVTRWLDLSSSTESLQSLLGPVADGLLTGHRVSPRVNAPRNNDASLIEALQGQADALLIDDLGS